MLVFPEYLHKIEEDTTNIKGFNVHDHRDLKSKQQGIVNHNIAEELDKKFT